MSEKIPVSQVLSWGFTQTKVEISPVVLAAYGGGIFGTAARVDGLSPLAVGDEVRVLGLNRKDRRAGRTPRGTVDRITEGGLVYRVWHQGGVLYTYSREVLEKVSDLELLAEEAPGYDNSP